MVPGAHSNQLVLSSKAIIPLVLSAFRSSCTAVLAMYELSSLVVYG